MLEAHYVMDILKLPRYMPFLPMAHLGQGFPFGFGARPRLQAVAQTKLMKLTYDL